VTNAWRITSTFLAMGVSRVRAIALVRWVRPVTTWGDAGAVIMLVETSAIGVRKTTPILRAGVSSARAAMIWLMSK